jgi:hypothetical protein
MFAHFMQDILKKQIITSLPKLFITEAMRTVDWAYTESFSACKNNPLMEEPEREWMYPLYRRAILEKGFRQLAQKSGGTATIETNRARNFRYTEVSLGRFLLTVSHHTGEERRMLRHSEFRKQNAELNTLLDQMEFGYKEFRKLDKGGMINAVLLHDHDLKDESKAGYVRLAFPAENNKEWATWFDLHEIVNAYPKAAVTNDDEELIIKWKSKAREQEL